MHDGRFWRVRRDQHHLLHPFRPDQPQRGDVMELQVTHETLYDYAPAVEIAQHVAYLQPLRMRHQQLLGHMLQITPTPTQIRQSLDIYGNARSFFSLQFPHTQLKVRAPKLVEECIPAIVKTGDLHRILQNCLVPRL